MFGPSQFSASSLGMRIIESANALRDTTERLFPASRHRSTRVRKKLIQRFGGEFRRVPCAFLVGGHTMVVHPALAAQISREIAANIDATTERVLMCGV